MTSVRMASKIRFGIAAGGRRTALLAACACALSALAAPAPLAQPSDLAPWRLVAGGEPVAWNAPRTGDSEVAAGAALAHLQRGGFLLARVDSVRGRTLYAARGPRAVVAEVRLEGAARLAPALVREILAVREGRRLRAGALDSSLVTLLQRYARAGRPAARATWEVDVSPDGRAGVLVRIDEGGAVRLAGVELVGATRTRNGFAARAAGVESGSELVSFEPETVRRDLLATGVFTSVGEPRIVVADGIATIRVPVTEAPPGAFDLLLGYLPSGAADGGGAVVGSGRLEVRNLFGGGRTIRLALVRDPGLTASVDLRVSDPYLLGLPLRIDGRFEGYGRDSTFSRQRYRGEAGYRVAPGLELTAGVVRESVQPGSFGARPAPGDSSGRPRIAQADAAFAGFGLRYARVDAPLAPRRGLLVEVFAERGRRRRSLPDSVAADASVVQQRLEATVRAFVPTLRRQSVVFGFDARVILGGRADAGGYDEGDLFRIGGASSLRGYDEDAFAGDAVGRALAEYRYAIDAESFAFTFVDVGYVRRPVTPDAPAQDDVKPGYGFGVQYRTPLGVATLSYALNPDLGAASGNVHVGLAFGL